MTSKVYYEEFSTRPDKLEHVLLPIPAAAVTIDPSSAADHSITAGCTWARITVVGTLGVLFDFVAAASLGGSSKQRGIAPNTQTIIELDPATGKIAFVVMS